MAKVKGPLMSLSASGSVGNTLTFSIWKGRPYVRELVTPSNPQTAGQVINRTNLGGLAKAAAAVLTSRKDEFAYGSSFFQKARDMAPSGQSWISYFQNQMSAKVSDAIAEAETAYAGNTSRWDTIVAGLNLVPYTGVGESAETFEGYHLAFFLAYFNKNVLLDDTIANLQDISELEVAGFIAHVNASAS